MTLEKHSTKEHNFQITRWAYFYVEYAHLVSFVFAEVSDVVYVLDV